MATLSILIEFLFAAATQPDRDVAVLLRLLIGDKNRTLTFQHRNISPCMKNVNITRDEKKTVHSQNSASDCPDPNDSPVNSETLMIAFIKRHINTVIDAVCDPYFLTWFIPLMTIALIRGGSVV
jgi:hypothetical protein